MSPRGNGLTAASYAPVCDLDPRLTGTVLEALREAGIAAYAVTASDQPVIGFELVVTGRPVDRLYVDAAAKPAALEIVEAALPDALPAEGLPAEGDEPVLAGTGGASPSAVPDLDLAFEQIVAGFDRTDDDGTAVAWPAAEQAPPAAPSVPVTDDDHFVPPTPEPLPELEPITKLAWTGLLGGPLIMLLSVFGIALPQEIVIFGVIAFVAGFVTLVARLRDRPEDADPDDGAVV